MLPDSTASHGQRFNLVLAFPTLEIVGDAPINFTFDDTVSSLQIFTDIAITIAPTEALLGTIGAPPLYDGQTKNGAIPIPGGFSGGITEWFGGKDLWIRPTATGLLSSAIVIIGRT